MSIGHLIRNVMERINLPTGPNSLSLYVSLISNEIVSSAVEGRARIGFLSSVFVVYIASFVMVFVVEETDFL
jgi:hypothetical protein